MTDLDRSASVQWAFFNDLSVVLGTARMEFNCKIPRAATIFDLSRPAASTTVVVQNTDHENEMRRTP